jgi:RHS repeat-associated protein
MVSDRYDYAAFGEVIRRTGTTPNAYQFASDRFDAAEGLTYLRARYYDPSSGRFISRDPFEGVHRDPVSLHRYLYAQANPVAFSDPRGEATLTSVMFNVVTMSVLIDVAFNVAGGKRPAEILFSAVLTAGFAALGGPRGANVRKIASSRLASAVARSGATRLIIPLAGALVDTTVWYVEALSKALPYGLIRDDSVREHLPSVQTAAGVFGANFILRLLPLGSALKALEEVALSVVNSRSRLGETFRIVGTTGPGGILASIAKGEQLLLRGPRGTSLHSSTEFVREALESLEDVIIGGDNILVETFGKASEALAFVLRAAASTSQ